MISLNVNEAKAGLSKYLAAVEAGETVVICRRNVPIAELRAVPSLVAKAPRPFGLSVDKGVPIPDSFFDELPEDLLRAFSGYDD